MQTMKKTKRKITWTLREIMMIDRLGLKEYKKNGNNHEEDLYN